VCVRVCVCVCMCSPPPRAGRHHRPPRGPLKLWCYDGVMMVL
jgi:hypothetical protein